MYMQGSYLRVLTPRTTNGSNLEIGPDGRVVYKEAHLPLSAKSKIEQYNRKLAQHLKKVIEVVNVGESKAQVKQNEETELLLQRLNEQDARMQQLQNDLQKMIELNQKLQSQGSVPANRKEPTDGNENQEKPATTIKPQPIK